MRLLRYCLAVCNWRRWYIAWDIFSPVNASLSAKSIFWEELCSCAVSTGSDKGTEIYVSVFCFICYVILNFNFSACYLTLIFLQSPLSFNLSAKKKGLTYKRSKLHKCMGRMICLFASIYAQIYYTRSRETIPSYDFELLITEAVLYFMSL